MENKFYVSYEAARLLKEKGYDEERDFLTPIYNENGSLYWSNHEDLSDKIPAITKSEAIDWLEGKGMVVDVRYDYDELQKDDSQWIYYIYQYDNEGQLNEMVSGWVIDGIYDTRLEAEEAAIIKALGLLKGKEEL